MILWWWWGWWWMNIIRCVVYTSQPVSDSVCDGHWFTLVCVNRCMEYTSQLNAVSCTYNLSMDRWPGILLKNSYINYLNSYFHWLMLLIDLLWPLRSRREKGYHWIVINHEEFAMLHCSHWFSRKHPATHRFGFRALGERCSWVREVAATVPLRRSNLSLVQ